MRGGAGDRDAKIAAVSGSVRGGVAAEIGAELRHQRANALLQKPIAPEAVPAASGRMLMAPAAEFAITKALPTITIICVPNSQTVPG